MSQETTGLIHHASEGGVAGQHPQASPFEMLVAPTTSDELNTARLRLIPVACWRVEDIRFAFNSSFVTPDIAAELQILVSLREAHKKMDASGKAQYPSFSVFGHADPVGSDDYNKALSGRRSTAIYALLISNSEPTVAVKLWQEIADTEHWGANQRQTMRTITGLPETTSDHDLFQAYMKALCPPELQVSRKDFLAQGADPGGKGDYQGCSEFNPLLIFSQEKQTRFEQGEKDKDDAVIADRNTENGQNRRVLVLLFRPGSRINPAKWPCPRATEGIAGCKKRFWSDGEKRRTTRLPDKNRDFKDAYDTFACRFFQRISNGSPCHKIQDILRIRLYDSAGKFIPFARYRLTIGVTTQLPDKADAKGFLTAREVEVPNRCLVEWGPPQDDSGTDTVQNHYPFRLELFLIIDQTTQESEAIGLLNNLGYLATAPLEVNVRAFQEDYGQQFGLEVTGTLDDNGKTSAAIRQVHDDCADNLRSDTEQVAKA